MEELNSGTLMSPCVQSDSLCHTSFAKQQCKIRCSAVSCSWLQKEQMGSHGHWRLLRLSAVRSLDWTSNHANCVGTGILSSSFLSCQLSLSVANCVGNGIRYEEGC
jgi:hypothetical protein